MRLVINSQGAVHAGLRRYNGRGIFGSIGRKLFSFGLKKVINAMEKEKEASVDRKVRGERSCTSQYKTRKSYKPARGKEKTKIVFIKIFTTIKSKKIF